MNKVFLSLLIVTMYTASAAQTKNKAKEQSNEATHNHSHEEESEQKGNHSDHEAKNEEEHDHEAEGGHEHGKEADHGHGESGHDHDEKEEESAAVGPDKGIVEANDKDGFKLSGEAFKNFDLKFMNVSSGGQITLPQTAIVLAGEEVNLFRMRNDFFKRIDFKLVRRSENSVIVTSPDLAPGDKIVIAGLGFLRIAELAAFGGVAHGHSH